MKKIIGMDKSFMVYKRLQDMAVFFTFISLVYFLSCKSKSSGANYNPTLHNMMDSIALNTFIANNPVIDGISLQNIKTLPSGLRYLIVSDTGRIITDSLSSVIFSYSLRIPNVNGIIDSVPNSFSSVGRSLSPLGNSFPGLVKGLELIHEGGRIFLFIPSSLGFEYYPVTVSYVLANQTTLNYTIPPNTPLIYEITLTSVINSLQ